MKLKLNNVLYFFDFINGTFSPMMICMFRSDISSISHTCSTTYQPKKSITLSCQVKYRWIVRKRVSLSLVHFLSLARSKLRLCSANHRPGYWSNLPCDWPSTALAYSEQETENGPWSCVSFAITQRCKLLWRTGTPYCSVISACTNHHQFFNAPAAMPTDFLSDRIARLSSQYATAWKL